MKPSYPAFLSPVILLSLASLWLAGCQQKDAAPPARVAEVGVITLHTQPQAIIADLPGRTSPFMISEVRPQVGGIIRQRAYTEGAHVQAGALLYQIEPAPYQASLQSAAAALQRAEATLVSLKLKAERYRALIEINAVSKQDNDDAQAAYQQGLADVASARAAVMTARINLDFTRVVSPISGFVSTSTVTPGALVTAGQDTALTTVQQLDPIYVDVIQSSSELLKLRQQIAAGKLQANAQKEVPIHVVLEDGSRYPLPGTLKFSGISVNTTSGAVTLRAVVPNPDGVLLPGMYVHARMDVAEDSAALLVPQRAVFRNTRGDPMAYLVNTKQQVEQRAIETDGAYDGQWRVTHGLQANDRVIMDGVQNIKPGDTVKAVAFQTTSATPSR